MFEVVRHDEFSPLKNATGVDSPTTVKSSLLAQHHRWAMAAGATLLDGSGNTIPPTARSGEKVLKCTLYGNRMPFYGGQLNMWQEKHRWNH